MLPHQDCGKTKPNKAKQTQFKPKQSQFQKSPNGCKLIFNKGLWKKCVLGLQKNKAKQSQPKPISKRLAAGQPSVSKISGISRCCRCGLGPTVASGKHGSLGIGLKTLHSLCFSFFLLAQHRKSPSTCQILGSSFFRSWQDRPF